MDARSDKKERREQWGGGGEERSQEECRGRCLGLTVLPLIPVGYSKGSSNSPLHPGDRTPYLTRPSALPPVLKVRASGRRLDEHS